MTGRLNDDKRSANDPQEAIWVLVLLVLSDTFVVALSSTQNVSSGHGPSVQDLSLLSWKQLDPSERGSL